MKESYNLYLLIFISFIPLLRNLRKFTLFNFLLEEMRTNCAKKKFAAIFFPVADTDSYASRRELDCEQARITNLVVLFSKS